MIRVFLIVSLGDQEGSLLLLDDVGVDVKLLDDVRILQPIEVIFGS